MDALVALMARLRDPARGCPWDLAQDFASVAPYTIEEAYEVADAIARGALDDLAEELGDLLFQVVFHARMAEERGAFAFDDVVRGIVAKLERRHPHVFAADAAGSGPTDADAVARAWAATKAAERRARGSDAPASELDGIPRNLPPATRAAKLQARAAAVGFDWPDAAGVMDKLAEEQAELAAAVAAGDRAHAEEELGDVLFVAVNLARHLGIDAERALAGANDKFERRFRHMEAAAAAPLAALDAAALEALWQAAKRAGA